MKMRILFLAMIPCLFAVGCGTEAEPTDNSLRGEQVEPCTPDDCIPLGAQVEDNCPPGTELQSGAECVDDRADLLDSRNGTSQRACSGLSGSSRPQQ